MTRETRIGLLLGLAFIIAFGMMLSEINRSGDTHGQLAQKPVIEPNYYQAADPHVGETAYRVPKPADQVAQTRRLQVHQPHVEIPVTQEPMELAQTPTPQPESSGMDLTPAQIARQFEQETQDNSSAPTERVYRVRPNDNLHKIARKMYGPENGHLFKGIYEANRHQISNAQILRVGQKLIIPSLAPLDDSQQPAVAQRPQHNSQYREMDMEQLQGYFGGNNSGKRIYIVRPGDNLTRIARKTLNDDSDEAVHRLFNANRDKLDNPNSLTAGMKLKIPS